MESKHFKTDYLSYWARFRKVFLVPFLVIAFVLIFFTHRGNYIGSILSWLSFFGILLGFMELYNSWIFINEIRIVEDRLIIIGYNFNSRWERDVEIKHSSIKIKSRGRHNVTYILRIESQGQTFDINKSFNWDYFSLLQLFHEFKRIKGEKIIFDEKYFLDIMEKKAHGSSSVDMLFGKDSKK